MLEHGRFLLPVKLFPNQQFFFLKFYLDGVSIFFVLSGFLIGQIILKVFNDGQVRLRTLADFWMRRWVRTLPNYFLVLCLLLLLGSLFNAAYTTNGTWKYFLFVQNFNSPHPPFFGEAWSLSIEEWFYLLLPVLLLAGAKLLKWRVRKTLMAGALVFILLPLALRFYRYYTMEVSDIYVWDLYFRKQVLTRMDSLMAGVLAAVCCLYYPKIFGYKKRYFFIAGLLLLVFNKALEVSHLAEWGVYQTVWMLLVNAIATVFLLPFLFAIKTGEGILYRSISLISLLSYSMYLLNLSLVQKWILPQFKLEDFFSIRVAQLFQYVIFWSLTIVLSYLLYTYFEKPVMNQRNRLSLLLKTHFFAR